ncbi:MAG: NADH-quinone oxidoreductase subunit N [Candidatus Dadabacteria bacterium]|nr:MAG: NADH-quinone oxidoreductase subunit N [Candidatus Dadabacteria bacterium]
MSAGLGSYATIAPILAACGWALLVLVVEMFSARGRPAAAAWLSVVGLAQIAWQASRQWGVTAAFGHALVADGLSVFCAVLVCAFALVAILMSMDYLPETDVRGAEYYPLVLFAVLGALVMVASSDLVVLFLGLETMSMAIYVLAGIWKSDLRSNESALKYFLMGAFASGFMLYGIALLYAETGSTMIGEVARAASGEPTGLMLVGVGLLLVGFGFKIAAVPFHLWTPDVYEGAPTSVTALMATLVKAAGFVAFVRVVVLGLAPHLDLLAGILWAGAVATMSIGNFVALRQTSLKRLLAYSAIAHTGYLLVGLTPGTAEGAAAALFYLVVYGAMNLGAFGVMMLLARRGNGAERISDYAGLGARSPVLALTLTAFLLSLTGIPPFGGFVGKVYLFAAALRAGYIVLVVIAVLNSVVSAAYYLGVVRTMYFEDGQGPAAAPRPRLALATAVALVVTVWLGVAPSGLIEAATAAVSHALLGS